LRIVTAHDYFSSEKPAEILVTHHRINLDAAGSESLAQHPSTTPEIKELCSDLKILGKKDLTMLLKWRMKILREREKAERAARKAEQSGASASAAGAGKAGGVPGRERQAGDIVAHDVNQAISEMLGESGAKGAKDDGSAAEEEADEQLEQELAEQVEKRRKEERREAKKTMERQKKQEWRKKMSLITSRNNTADQPELFKLGKKAVEALENQDEYLDASKLDSDREDSGAEDEATSESDSDEGLDRYARMEVDIAVDMHLRKIRNEDKYRTQMQRVRKIKKESRRQRVMAAWAGELNEFNAAIQNTAAGEKALRDKDSDDDEDDDGSDGDSDADLKILRNLQAEGTGDKEKRAIDGEALSALLNGPDGEVDAPQEAGEAPEKAKEVAEASSSTALAVRGEDANIEDLRAEHRMARWFSQDIFKSVGAPGSRKIMPLDRDSDDDAGSDAGGRIREVDDSKLPRMPLTDKQKRSLKRKKDEERNEKRGKKRKDDIADEDKGPLEIAPLEAPKPLVPTASGSTAKPSDPKELAETLALGSLLVDSKKSRMDIIDAAYNRWAFEEDPTLPDWFTEEENRFNKPELPISKELMAQFRAKLREINARPIRKVTEARARKKRRLNKRLEKLRSTAMSLVDSPDMSEAAKAKQMRKAVRNLAKQEERKVTVVAIKKGGGGKRMNKGKVPKGAKVKVVDRRMKSDRRGLKKAEARNKSKHKALARKRSLKKQNKAGRRGLK